MQIVPSDGYYPESVFEIGTVRGQCCRCRLLGVNEFRLVASLDRSDGEFAPILLCFEHLLMLAHEVAQKG